MKNRKLHGISFITLVCLFGLWRGKYGFSLGIQDIQHLLFPIILLGIFFFFRKRAFGLASLGLVVFLPCWLISNLSSRGVLGPNLSSQVYLARLSGDPHGEQARQHLRAHQEVAQTYGLVRMKLLERSFSSFEQARRWQDEKTKVPVLVYGDSEWPSLSFRPSDDFQKLIPKLEWSPTTDNLAEELALVEERDFFRVRLAGTNLSFALAHSPEFIRFSKQPINLSRHFIAWLADGLASKMDVFLPDPFEWRSSNKSSGMSLSLRRGSFIEASKVDGPWRSGGPRAFAFFLLGLLDTFEGVGNLRSETSPFVCAEKHYRKSAGFATQRFEPQVASIVFNNAAIAVVLQEPSPENLARAQKWLQRASRTYTQSGQPSLGTRIAMLNLIQLTRAGLL